MERKDGRIGRLSIASLASVSYSRGRSDAPRPVVFDDLLSDCKPLPRRARSTQRREPDSSRSFPDRVEPSQAKPSKGRSRSKSRHSQGAIPRTIVPGNIKSARKSEAPTESDSKMNVNIDKTPLRDEVNKSHLVPPSSRPAYNPLFDPDQVTGKFVPLESAKKANARNALRSSERSPDGSAFHTYQRSAHSSYRNTPTRHAYEEQIETVAQRLSKLEPELTKDSSWVDEVEKNISEDDLPKSIRKTSPSIDPMTRFIIDCKTTYAVVSENVCARVDLEDPNFRRAAEQVPKAIIEASYDPLTVSTVRHSELITYVIDPETYRN